MFYLLIAAICFFLAVWLVPMIEDYLKDDHKPKPQDLEYIRQWEQEQKRLEEAKRKSEE